MVDLRERQRNGAPREIFEDPKFWHVALQGLGVSGFRGSGFRLFGFGALGVQGLGLFETVSEGLWGFS